MKEQNNYIQGDEITLKELILNIQEYFWEVVRNWKIVLMVSLLFMGYMLYKAYVNPVKYTGTLTFMVNDDDGGGGVLGGLGGLAASFGLGGGGGSEYNLKKIHALLKTRSIIQQALFEKVEVRGKVDFIANHIIREYDLNESWKEDTTGLNDFLFKDGNFETFNRTESTVLQVVHGKVLGNKKAGIAGLLFSEIEDETGIMAMSVVSTNEALSLHFVKDLYAKLSEYYISKTIEKQKHTYELIVAKTDSIRALLNSNQYRILKFQDTHKNLMRRQDETEVKRLQMEVQTLAYAYGKALENQEAADFSLKTKTPFMQEIDIPISPLPVISKGFSTYIKSLIIGGFLGGFLSVGFIIARSIYRSTME